MKPIDGSMADGKCMQRQQLETACRNADDAELDAYVDSEKKVSELYY